MWHTQRLASARGTNFSTRLRGTCWDWNCRLFKRIKEEDFGRRKREGDSCVQVPHKSQLELGLTLWYLFCNLPKQARVPSEGATPREAIGTLQGREAVRFCSNDAANTSRIELRTHLEVKIVKLSSFLVAAAHKQESKNDDSTLPGSPCVAVATRGPQTNRTIS